MCPCVSNTSFGTKLDITFSSKCKKWAAFASGEIANQCSKVCKNVSILKQDSFCRALLFIILF
jgi:hypothetical protein